MLAVPALPVLTPPQRCTGADPAAHACLHLHNGLGHMDLESFGPLGCSSTGPTAQHGEEQTFIPKLLGGGELFLEILSSNVYAIHSLQGARSLCKLFPCLCMLITWCCTRCNPSWVKVLNLTLPKPAL